MDHPRSILLEKNPKPVTINISAICDEQYPLLNRKYCEWSCSWRKQRSRPFVQTEREMIHVVYFDVFHHLFRVMYDTHDCLDLLNVIFNQYLNLCCNVNFDPCPGASPCRVPTCDFHWLIYFKLTFR